MKSKSNLNPFFKVFKYCPRCRGPFVQTKFNLFVCKNCGLELYENPRFANIVILENEDGEVLVIKRKFPPREGFLDFPGGFVDLGETVEQSVKRELKEELDLNIKSFKFFSFSDPELYEFKGLRFQTISIIFTSKISSEQTKKTKAQDDVGEILFYKPAKIPINKLAFKNMQKVIKEYLDYEK